MLPAFFKNTIVEYSFLLIQTIKIKNFTQMGKVSNKSADTVKRLLPDAQYTKNA